jgi:hypothetical protein
MRILSLGAGVQSTTLLLLSASGELEHLDAAIFADTGAEPQAVYDHLDRLEEQVAKPAGIPIYRVSYGNLGDDLLDADRMAMIPAYTLGPEKTVTVVDAQGPCPQPCGWLKWHNKWTQALRQRDILDGSVLPGQEALQARADAERPKTCSTCNDTGLVATRSHTEVRRDKGMLGRKCTQTYKLRPLLDQVRLLLGASTSTFDCKACAATGQRVAPWRAKRGEDAAGVCSVCRGTRQRRRVGQPPAGLVAEQWVGFSTDEVTRISDRGDTRYSKSRYPLLELGMSREQCIAYLRRHGWGTVAKSACTFCPYRGNAEWRQMRDTDPRSWQEATSFDEAYRVGAGMRGKRYLHITCTPLATAPIDRVRPSENTQLDLIDLEFEDRLEAGDPDGCSPFGCRSGEPVTAEPLDLNDLDGPELKEASWPLQR